jgi:hypothetical protein
MAESPGFVRRVGSVLLITGTILGLYNVYADNAEVQALAERKACGERPCTARITRESRSPISQNFTYQVELTEKGKPRRQASVDVECQRAYYLFGEYSCTAQGVLPP